MKKYICALLSLIPLTLLAIEPAWKVTSLGNPEQRNTAPYHMFSDTSDNSQARMTYDGGMFQFQVGPTTSSFQNALVINQSTRYVSIGTNTATSMLTVNGAIESLSGGYKFPDGSVLLSTSGISGGGMEIGSHIVGSTWTTVGQTLGADNSYLLFQSSTGALGAAENVNNAMYVVHDKIFGIGIGTPAGTGSGRGMSINGDVNAKDLWLHGFNTFGSSGLGQGGHIFISSGSVAMPSYNNMIPPYNSGMYFPDDGLNLGFVTEGTERVRISSNSIDIQGPVISQSSMTVGTNTLDVDAMLAVNGFSKMTSVAVESMFIFGSTTPPASYAPDHPFHVATPADFYSEIRIGGSETGLSLYDSGGGTIELRDETHTTAISLVGGDGSISAGSITVDTVTTNAIIVTTNSTPGYVLTDVAGDGIGVWRESTGKKHQITIIIDGGGSIITTGSKKIYTRVPCNMTLTGWDIVADQTGSIVVDLWKDTYANFPPTVADSFAGSEKPTLSSSQKNQDTSLTSMTTTLSIGDYIEANVDSASTITKAIITLYGVER